ncbi:hypothetical protein GRI58_12375 [Porphyrobacter algicida]|uniref:Uncharacterized protein n=1 Tax=Qipengyuania algicida TaxID=1836209 RepID=A0A845AGA4_9SPHN|nr:hypothetical protein [Qipengyuania algicida]MXP29612.1 hypothetical protein [Qipengyuania algicida]
MIDIRTCSRFAVLTVSCIGLISAAPPNEVPGRGVLCLGTFIYFVEKVGNQCRAGQDPEFQARIASYSQRFDDYIVRNTGGDPAVLEKFKEGQNLNSEDHRYICEGDVAESYDGFKSADAGELDRAVDELLADDGPPSFGDCV